MAEVFISYSREDLDKVRPIAQAVQGEGYDLWWDKDLPPHLSYTEVIQEKISGAKAVIVVWSEEAGKSEWVRAEADMARNQNKLIQTSIDDGMPPLPFNQIQFASLSDWQGERDHPAWRKVLLSLNDLVGRDAKEIPAAPVSTPASPPKAEEPPHPAPPAEAKNQGNQLPLMISILSLLLVAGLVGWLALRGDDTDTDSEADRSEAIAETEVEPAIPAEDVEPAEPQTAEPPPQAENTNEFNESAVINDADGWTNFRSAPSRSASIIGRIEDGQVFYTHKQSGQWWKIRADDGEIGYMHYSRISLTSSRPTSPKEYFPDSDSRLISAAELEGLSAYDLRIARNEIFARKGRIFKSADLRNHFSRFSWYQPVSNEVPVNDIEKANARAMKAEEARR